MAKYPVSSQNTLGRIGGGKSLLPAKSSPQALTRENYSQRLTARVKLLPSRFGWLVPFPEPVMSGPSNTIYEASPNA